jgi:3'-phosphoadenosine 5'-phosphosulfate sulfotransferase (PAPS reductase)/FAD synthetase
VSSLERFRWIVINSSAGKDSQTALHVVVQACKEQGIPMDRLVVSHQDLGEAEWPGTQDLVHKQAEHYGLRVIVVRRRDKDGKEESLLDYVRRRKKWPSSTTRYCTSDFKRGPGTRVITQLWREAEGDILNVFGFRSEESPARAKKVVWEKNVRCCTKKRTVYDWLPIHDWSEEQVWRSIKDSGVPWHPAYDLGMPRLSCMLCIFSPKAALMIAGKANPEILDKYCEVEEEIGHTFQHKRSLCSIRDAIREGEAVGEMDGVWNM